MPRPLNLADYKEPLVAELAREIERRGVVKWKLMEKAGVAQSSLLNWKRQSPHLGNFVAVLNAMGLDLRICAMEEAASCK